MNDQRTTTEQNFAPEIACQGENKTLVTAKLIQYCKSEYETFEIAI